MRPSVSPAKQMPTVLRLAGLWVIWCVWAHLAGWGLSALGALHARGYLLWLPLLIIACVIFWRKTAQEARATGLPWRKWCERIKTSPVWIAWCFVVILVLIGALAHAPSNYDGITYRLPRLLYWLQENRWHWIQGLDHRQNVSGLGHEWMITPMIAITRSDRALFLINFVPYLLLPGLFYISACGLGIRSRVAAWWMCLVPLAYGITLQAGSIGNDFLPMALGLAAIAFAAQARKSYPILCLVFSLLSAAAMTGAKATAIPLILPIGVYWLWVAWQMYRWQQFVKAIGIAIPLAIPSSIIPLAIACTIYTGHWAGNPGNRHGAQASDPITGVVSNSLQLACGLIQPPVFPASKKAQANLCGYVKSDSVPQWLNQEHIMQSIDLGGEIPIEEFSGVGFGLGFLLLIALTGAIKNLRRPKKTIAKYQCAIIICTFISIVACMSKLGTGGFARLSLPYFPLAIFCILFLFNKPPLRGKYASRAISMFPVLAVFPALFLNPNRPLVPYFTLCNLSILSPAFKKRIATVYQAYEHRSCILSPILDGIPESVTIGFAGSGDHSALGLFKPYGSRKVINLTPENESKVDWVVALPEMLEKRLNTTFIEWEKMSYFKKTSQKDIVSFAAKGPETWYIYQRK